MLMDNIESVQVKMLKDLSKGEGIFSPVGIFDSEECIDFIVYFISEEEVGLLKYFVGDAVSNHISECAFVVFHQSSVIPCEVGIILVEIGSDPVI